MYAGHAGLALLAKGARPRLPIAVLVLVAFAPDWIEWLLGAKGGVVTDAAVESHGLPSIAVGMVVVGAAALVLRRGWRDALVLVGLYGSHWLADLVTGRKPTWRGGPVLGLALYDHPALDFALEAAITALCALVYMRSLPPERRWRAGWLAPALLIGMQAAFNVVLRGMG